MLKKLALYVLLASCLVPFATAKDKEKFQQPGPVRLDKDGDKWARNTLKKHLTRVPHRCRPKSASAAAPGHDVGQRGVGAPLSR